MLLKNRLYTEELLDAPDIPAEDLFLNLKELNTINTLLGGHAVTLKGLKQFGLQKNQTYKILEIGCGGGDNLLYLAKWARKNGYQLQFWGLDIKLDCIRYATEQCKNYPEIQFIQSDYKQLHAYPITFDIGFSSLFCHHFPETELRQLIQLQETYCRLGFFINDLHRHWFAYASIKVLTQLFSKSYLVKNDAPLSVQRGFIRKDFEQFLPTLKQGYHIQWAWAFRWLLVYKNKAHETGI